MNSIVSTGRFSFKKNEFIAEISDLGPDFRFRQIYPDSCDEGMTLVSHKTGVEIDYVVFNTKLDSEGDIQFWQLMPIKASQRKVPACRDTTILLFND